MATVLKVFGEDECRFATDDACAFGIALYSGRVVGDEVRGDFVANVGDDETAKAWVETGDESLLEGSLRSLTPRGL